MDINEVTIAGRLGADPDLKQMQSGDNVCNLRIATNKVWIDKQGNKQKSTEWVSCVAYGKNADNIARYFQKGQEIYVRGRLHTSSWDGQDGQKRYKTEVVIERFQFVGSNKDAAPRTTDGREVDPDTGEVLEQAPLEADDDGIRIEDIPF